MGFFFPSERDQGVLKIVSYLMNSLFHLKHKHVKIVNSDKRQCHTGYICSSCMVKTEHLAFPCKMFPFYNLCLQYVHVPTKWAQCGFFVINQSC